MNLPIDFEAKIRGAKNASGGGYPVQISARDLMSNFVYAALDVDVSLVEETTGQGGLPSRKLKIPAVPSGGTYVLGSVDGSLQWLSTEEC